MKQPQLSQSTPSDNKAPTESQMEPSRSLSHPSPSTLPTNYQRSSKQQRLSLRAGFAVIAGRTAGALSRRLHLGGGTSIVGAIAQRIYPEIVEHLATQLEYGSILVTGTNGKTTTSSFIAAIIQDDGLRVWRNREGSNLMRGVAGAMVIRAQPNGNLRRSGRAISVLETDEMALPKVVQAVSPRVVVFTNLFRDQLDRYGEVDTILAHWQQTIQRLPKTTTLVLNADDPIIAHLANGFAGPVVFFGVNDLSVAEPQTANARHQAIDAHRCGHCGHDFHYSTHFYSHLGHYACKHCGTTRPQPEIAASNIQMNRFDRYHLTVNTPNGQHKLVVPLPGLYNIYNALAAISVAHVLNIDWEPITLGIEQFKPVFGRGERIQTEGRTLRLLLAKNPTGLNEVLRTLSSDKEKRHLLFILNDNIADGRDISWIWDVDFSQIVNDIAHVVVAGTRALDLALRLRYADLPEDRLHIVPLTPLRSSLHPHRRANKKHRAQLDNREHALAKDKKPQDSQDSQDSQFSRKPTPTRHYGLKNALNIALQQTPPGETLFVVPTYTGLLEIHRELEHRGLTPRYWEGCTI